MKYSRANRLFAILAIVAMMVAVFLKEKRNITKYYASGYDVKIPFLTEQVVDNTIDNTTLAQCTHAELSIIKHQLPPDDCLKYAGQPYRQNCSLSYATRCPDSVWLEKFYTKIHQSAAHNHNRDHPTSKSKPSSPPPFLGIFVGCNKGFDAINAMRMGSGNPIFDKDVWKDAMTDHGKKKLQNDVCNQLTVPQFALQEKSRGENNRTSDPVGDKISFSQSALLSQVHCIEPMPATALALQRAAYETKYDKQGFIVTHAAMAKEDGYVQFASGKGKVGVENKGISNGCTKGACMNVTMYSLDTYLEKFVPKGMPINYLSVDVEGWDFEVLLGGKHSALPRVQYLEFEYNWVGPWAKQPLSEVIEYLDGEFGFTCYWAGFNNTIWRITNCWLDHYDKHIWSNIACVNRNFGEVRGVAEDMENLFNETMEKGEDAVRDYEHRYAPPK